MTSLLPTPAARRGARRRLVAAVAVLGLALLFAPAAGATESTDAEDAAAGLGLAAVLGFDGTALPGQPAPVTVTVHPDRPIQGTLRLTSARDGAVLAQEVEIEVGAGVEKRFHLLSPRAQFGMRVSLTEEGADEAAVVEIAPRPPDGYLVAALGRPATDLPDVTTAQTGDRAVAVSLAGPVLDLGPDALASLSAVVVRQADLVDLDPTARRHLATATSDGLQLVVTDVTDPDLGLPWRPATGVTGRALERAPAAWAASTASFSEDGADQQGAEDQVAAIRAGRGRVVATTLALGDAALGPVWPHVLQPSRTDGAAPLGMDGMDEVAQAPDVFRATTGDAPGVVWIAVFLLAYLVVVGPVVGIVLHRRRRPELAWVVVPTVTALFAATAFLGAVGSRPRVGVTGQAEAWIDGVGTQVVASVVRAPTSGTHEFVLPGDSWHVDAAGWESDALVRYGPDAARATVRLRSQSTGGVLATRSATGDAPLDVEAAIIGNELRVEVTNTSGVDLRQVRVHVAALAQVVAADLPAGDTVTETLSLPDELPGLDDPFDDPRWRLLDNRHGDDDAAVLQLLLGDRVDTTRPGVVWATAVTDETRGDAEVSIDGSTPVSQGTYLAVGVTPTTTDDATHPAEVTSDVILADGAPVWRDGATMVGGEANVPVRIRLPREGAPAAVRVDAFSAVFGDRGFVGPEDGMFECPPDAISCEFDEFGGEICFPDGTCEGFEMAQPPDVPRPVQPVPPRDAPADPADPAVPTEEAMTEGPGLAPQPPPDVDALLPPGLGSGIELWDHETAAWVPVSEDMVSPTTELARWVGPLGDLWVRNVGGFVQFDLARVAAAVEIGAAT